MAFNTTFRGTDEYRTTAEIRNGGASRFIIEILVVLCACINGILLCITIWILLCMIVHGIKAGKFKRTESGMMYIYCLIAVTLSTPRILFDRILFHVKDISGASAHCETIVDSSNCAYGFALFSAYTFLWFRQKAIHAHPFVRTLGGKWIKKFSWSVLIILLIAFVALILGYVLPSSYASSKTGCIFKISQDMGNYSRGWEKARRYVLLGALVFGQVTLIYLFVYPMIRVKAQQGRTPRSNQSAEERNSSSQVVRRSLICAVIVVISDFLTVILTNVVIPWDYPIVISYTVYDFSIVLNSISIMSTFGNNRKILLTFCRLQTLQRSAASPTNKNIVPFVPIERSSA